jgi:hypothetical protein
MPFALKAGLMKAWKGFTPGGQGKNAGQEEKRIDSSKA